VSGQLTNGLRLALDQLQAMVQSYRTRHPMPNWCQQRIWQDASRELWYAGFSPDYASPALELYEHEQREAARSDSSATTSTTEEA